MIYDPRQDGGSSSFFLQAHFVRCKILKKQNGKKNVFSFSFSFWKEFVHKFALSPCPNTTSLIMIMATQCVLLLTLLAGFSFSEGKNQVRDFKEGGSEAPTEEELAARNDLGFGKPRRFREENNVLILVSFLCDLMIVTMMMMIMDLCLMVPFLLVVIIF